MKKIVLSAAVASLFLTACEKKTTVTVDEAGNTTTVETVDFDKERIDSTAKKVGNKIEIAAEQTGDALKETGQNIKEKVNDADLKLKERKETKRTDTVR